MAVVDQLNGLTLSSDVFATATLSGQTMAPANGTNWTNDNSTVGGNGTSESITMTVLDDVNDIVEFDITQANGNVETIFGQAVGWNGWIIGFQAFSSFDGTTLSGDVPGVPFFYLSDTALGAGAAPVDGTNVSTSNTTTLPVFLDPQVPPNVTPLLLNNAAGLGTNTGPGGGFVPYYNLVGQTFSSDNVSIIGNITQDPTTLTISAVANPLTETFTQAFGSGSVSVVNAWNDAQVVELQDGGQTFFAKLIGFYSDGFAGDGALLFQVYSNFDPTTGGLSHSAADANNPYILLSQQSLAATGGMPATGTGGDENSFSLTASPPFASGTGPLDGMAPLNVDMHTLLGLTFSSDNIANTIFQPVGNTNTYVVIGTDGTNWTQDTDPTVGGSGTAETVKIIGVNDTYQVAEFQITGGPQGTQTLFAQLGGYNPLMLVFTNASFNFDPTTGALSNPVPTFSNFAIQETTIDPTSGFPINTQVIPDSTIGAPLFLQPNTPAPALDLSALNGQAIISDYVGADYVAEQNPTTLAINLVSSPKDNTFTGQFGGGDPNAGEVVIANVYNQFQVVELQYVDTSSNVDFDAFGQVVGYNGSSLLLRMYDQFDPTTGPSFDGNEGVGNPSFVVLSDANVTVNSLAGTSGFPTDDVFTTNGSAMPFGLSSELCFCAGTQIATPTGDVPVEQLAAGDLVMTESGEARPIVWIGVGRVMVTRGRRSAATPVIVRKDAFDHNVPHRDLRVTKGHSFHIDNVLIPVEFLVNHRSIVWDDHAQEVSIYHIELETHDVLLANGAPAESYRDDGNRWLFQNANSNWSLPPQQPCAPVLTGGPIVDEIWRRLLDRTGPRNGLPLTGDPDLHLLVDGRRVDAVARRGLAQVFQLPAPFGSVRIASRSAVPAELGLARDPRSLGIALRQIVVRQGARFHTIEAANSALVDGFHGFEPISGLRWTDGDALLPNSLLAGIVPGGFELVLRLGETAQYIDDGEATRAA